MTRDEIEAADPQPGGWALVKLTNMHGWARVFAVDRNQDGLRPLGVSTVGTPEDPGHTRWPRVDEIHAIAPPSDEPPPLAQTAEPDDNTIAGYAERILDILAWELPSTRRAPDIDQLALACRALLNGRDAARLLIAQAEAKRRPGSVRGGAADLIDAVEEP